MLNDLKLAADYNDIKISEKESGFNWKKGILLKGDNFLYAQIADAYRDKPLAIQYMKVVFGLEGNSLIERVKSGLAFYKLISTDFEDIFNEFNQVKTGYPIQANLTLILFFARRFIIPCSLTFFWNEKWA